jgi:tRNA(fMet)-specific endonuclease VapC
MKVLLDTNICIYVIRKRPLEVLDRFGDHPVGEIGLSTITLAELQDGVSRSRYPDQNSRALAQFLLPLEIVPFDGNAAKVYGSVRASLEAQGSPIGPLDTLIAAHALSLGVTLVTNNTREFSRVPNLLLADWTRPTE